MSRIGIDSPDLGFRVLCYLIELAESGELDPLIQAGFSAETLSALREMPVGEINRMAGTLGLFDLGVNVPRITAALAARMNCIAVATPMTYSALHAGKILGERWIVDDPAQLIGVVQQLLDGGRGF